MTRVRWLAAVALIAVGATGCSSNEAPDPGGPVRIHEQPADRPSDRPDDRIKRIVLDVNGHVLVMKSTSDFTEYRDVAAVSAAVDPDVAAATPFTFNEVVLAAGSRTASAIVKGVATGTAALERDFGRYVVAGTFRDTGAKDVPPIVLGAGLARRLQVQVGDEVYAVAPLSDPTTGGSAAPLRQRTRVIAILSFEFEDYDDRFAFTTLAGGQGITGAGDQVMGIELRLKDPDRAAAIAKALGEKLGGPYTVTDWCELNRAFLKC